MLAHQIETPVREVLYRTRGHTRGPITRLVSPSDLGELMKPFVFLDLAVFEGNERIPMDQLWHPHSGIATVTVILDGAVRVAETTGTDEVLPAGSIEWMRAGNGVWHTGQAQPGDVKVFQLWVALPPELENGPSQSHYVMPDEVPTDGRVRVILGTYDGMTSPIAAPPMMTYLVVRLLDGERWTFTPPKGHDVAWVAVGDGALRTVRADIPSGEVAVFAKGSEPIDFIADGPTRFVLGSARKHPHDLVLGYYSVHTSGEALEEGETEIRRIGAELEANGTLRRRVRI
ncbi:Pirin-related protein [Labilithrix luteola]|uniref:Pirin-related protein n=1 Tax=Labilithrix luteola TaxID=1391654 RepID=A0A0K1PL38_9BACT|nr:pirin family protein [Labilithrix luteola]AKU93834.1 Pirin-related protein [Labilithrix luteola]